MDCREYADLAAKPTFKEGVEAVQNRRKCAPDL
jgi:hypothetical protein